MQSLEGQRIVVTGGSRGLGLGIVEALVSSKARPRSSSWDPIPSDDLASNDRGNRAGASLRRAMRRRRASRSTPS